MALKSNPHRPNKKRSFPLTASTLDSIHVLNRCKLVRARSLNKKEDTALALNCVRARFELANASRHFYGPHTELNSCHDHPTFFLARIDSFGTSSDTV